MGPPWEPPIGFPWQRPNVSVNWMRQYDASGDLDWLVDFRKLGGFPINVAFLRDRASNVLIASSLFATPILWRPGLSIYVKYTGRICGHSVTAAFAERFAKRLARTGVPYSSMQIRPVLATVGALNERSSYADITQHFHSSLPAVSVSSWTFVPYAPPPSDITPHVASDVNPTWHNGTSAAIGPLRYLCVFGDYGASAPELAWFTKFADGQTIPAGEDVAPIGDHARFWLRGT